MELDQSSIMDRIRQNGLSGVSVIELVTVMVTRGESDLEINEPNVRAMFRGYPIAMYKDLSLAELQTAGSLDFYEATRVQAAIELGRRAAMASFGPKESPVTSSQEAHRLFRHIEGQKQEHFCAAYFNSKANPITIKTIHIGTLNMSVVGAREVFREAVRYNSASIIVAHNHPSGDPEPSPEDIQVTQKLIRAGELLEIPLMDHIIIGSDGSFVSLRNRGHIR